MAQEASATPMTIDDYEAIESAVMETARGRWFLAEYARRNRNSDTDAILKTLDRLEKTIKRDRAVPDIDRIRLDLADMAEAISRTKQEIAQMKLETEHGGRFSEASQELDAIVSQTELATNDILLNAEKIQELAWTLREAKVEDAFCDQLDTCSTEIYTACSFQDLTGQRTRKVVTVLRYLESRINSMIGIWGLDENDVIIENADGTNATAARPDMGFDTRPDAHLLNGPQLHGRGIDQGAVDDLMDFDKIDFDAIDVDDVAFADHSPLAAAEDHEPDAVETPFETAAIPTIEIGTDVPEPVADAPAEIEAAVETAVVIEPAEAAADTVAPAPSFEFDEDHSDLEFVPVTKEVPAAEAQIAEARVAEAQVAAETSADDDRPADVFAPADPAPARPEAPAAIEPTSTTVVVGNTVLAVTPAAVAAVAVDPTPDLAIVPNKDPIEQLSPASRLIVFG